jgi:hypothetical protein
MLQRIDYICFDKIIWDFLKTLKWGTPSSFHAIMPIEMSSPPSSTFKKVDKMEALFFFFFVFEKRD